jgi:hypothetical protein
MISSVCIFGDSVAKGVVFDEVKKRYSFLQECFTRLICQNSQILVANYAKFGYTLKHGKSLVEKHQRELAQYDYVNWNRRGRLWITTGRRCVLVPNLSPQCHTPIDQFAILRRPD